MSGPAGVATQVQRGHDERFMAAAVALARRATGRVWPNPAVGALIVRDTAEGAVMVGRGVTSPPGGPHAEVMALRMAGEAARGATCYVTLEPCSHLGRTGPCAVALAEAGVGRVVVGLSDPNPRVSGRGVAMLRDAGVDVTVGVCAALCRRHHAGHSRRVLEGRPHVHVKLAVSADGALGRRGDGQSAITGEEVRRRVHLERAACDAILVGIGTAVADDPDLTCRLPGLEARSPVRVVLDPTARLPLDSRLVQTAGLTPVWVLTANDADYERTDALAAAGCTIVRLATTAAGRIDPLVALRALGQRGITRVLVEGGGAVAGAFLDRDVVDEAVLYHGTVVVGADPVLPFGTRDVSALAQTGRFVVADRGYLGPDRYIRYSRKEV